MSDDKAPKPPAPKPPAPKPPAPKPPAPKPPAPKPAVKDEREARLAAALRANLRRRKAGEAGKPD